MRKYIKTILIFIIIFSVTFVVSMGVFNLQKENSIDTILASENYSYLPVEAKDYIKEVYEETGEVILTEKNKEENVPYLNPSYVSYLALSESEKEEVDLIPIPYIVDYIEVEDYSNEELPSSFDLRNVNGKNYITPLKNQSTLGLCWAFSTVEQAESYLMLTNNKSYDSTVKTFSVRQIDYGTSYNGLIDYTNEYGYRNLTAGGNFYMASFLMSNGLSLIDDTLMPYDLKTDKKELQDILNYSNSLYEIDSTVNMSSSSAAQGTTEHNNYLNAVNSLVYQYGGAYVGTGSPTGSCGSKNTDGKYIIVDNSSCNTNANYGGHAMQIIGWDDNYEYSYCQSGSTHKSVNSQGTCDSGTLVTGKGAWLIRNSWGNNTPYVYLSYNSNVIMGIITAMSNDKNWDNNYNNGLFRNGLLYSTTSKTTTFTKKVNTPEKLEKIKFMASGSSGNYTISVTSGSKTYKNIKTVNADYPGIYTVDLSDNNILLEEENFKVTVSSTNSVFLMSDSISVFTSNVEETPTITLEDIKVTNNTMRLYSDTKSIPSGTALTYKLYNFQNVDVSEYLTITNNVVAENNVNTLANFSSALDGGIYRLDVIYNSNVIKSVNVKFQSMNGDGTESNPYVISTPFQLSQIRDDLDAYYVLGNDIDLSEDTAAGGMLSLSSNTCPAGFGWEAINGFSGSLDGKGYTIRGLRQENYLTCKVNNDNWKTWTNTGNGLFTNLHGNASIRNLTLEDFDITCQGGKCGILASSYSNSLNDSSDKTEYTANFENIIVKNSKIKGTYNIYNTDSGLTHTYGGGLFGYVESYYGNVNISNIYLDIDIDSSDLRNVAYLISQLSANNANIQNIQLNGELNGEFDDGSGDNLLIDKVFGNVTIKNILSTVTATNVGSNLLGTIWADSLDISNVNVLKNSDNGLCYSDNKNLCDNNTNINIYDKNTELLELVNKNNYSSWDNFDSNWIMRTVDGVSRIPVLSIVGFEYISIPNILLGHELNKKVSIFDYLTPKSEPAKRLTFKSNDESIVKIDDLGNIYPQSTGNTTLHIESYYDGYIYDLPINVTYIPHYTIVFDANGGTGTMNNIEVRVGEYYQLPNNTFMKENYEFKGWNTEPDGTGESFPNLGQVRVKNDKETITLYAQWIGKEMTITLDANGGTVTPNKKVVRYGETYGELPIPSREGYAFSGWSKKEGSLLRAIDSLSTVTSSTTLTASWRENAYNIIYDANGGVLKEIDSSNYLDIMSNTLAVGIGISDTTLSKNIYEKEGYQFKEWNTEPDGTGISYQENQRIELNREETPVLKLYAIWRLDKGVITYHSNDETDKTVIQEIDFDVDTKLDKNVFTKEGYEFKEWNTESDGSGTSYTDEQIINLSSDIDLYAQWKIKERRITFQANDGTNQKIIQTVTIVGPVSLNINTFVRENYQFINWNTNADGTGISYSDGENISFAGDIELYAIWKETYDYIIKGYSVDEEHNYISSITPNTPIDDFKKNIVLNDSYALEIDSKLVNDTEVLYTGGKTRILKDGISYAEFTNVVTGDTNGDGKINYLDYVNVYNHIQKEKHPENTKKLLVNEYLLAADMSGDNKINYLDYVRIYNKIKELKGGTN